MMKYGSDSRTSNRLTSKSEVKTYGHFPRYDITRATSAAATHLRKAARGHGLSNDIEAKSSIAYGQDQLSLQQAIDGGVELSQEAANVFGYFNVQQFRLAFILWLVDNNMPMEIIAWQSTRDMIKFANPEAESVAAGYCQISVQGRYTQAKNINLGKKLEIMDAELAAVYQAL
jgi:hypothetical protein